MEEIRSVEFAVKVVFHLSGIHILNFFFKTGTRLCSVSTFARPGVIFVYVVFWKNEYILDNISRNLVQKV